MQIVKEQKIGDCYVSDVDISKDEWLEILKDETVSEKYKEAVICYYYMPDYKGACVAVGNRLGKNAYSLVATIMNFGKYVQKRLARFQVIDEDGNNTYWPIPMKQGKALSNKEEGNFEWTLRDELVEAIREYLLWYLMERYKELRLEMPLRCKVNGVDWDELYKWELITECQGKDNLYIANRIKGTNLVYTTLTNGTIEYLLTNKKEEFDKVISDLGDESIALTTRLMSYKKGMEELIPDKYKFKANDERTAATILTCCNPDKYTFYKYEGMYENFCKYLGEDKKQTGLCYEHYLNLIHPLAEMAAENYELQNLVSPMLVGLRKSDMLLAQDVVWMLLCAFPKRLGYLQHIVWPIRYWCVGYNFGGHESQLSRFLENFIWEGRFDEKNNKALLQRARQIRPKDILVLKTSFTKGTGHKLSCIRVSALAEVKEIEELEDNGFVGVRCKVDYFYYEDKDFDGAKYGKYRKTIDECTDKDIIEFAIKVKDMSKSNLQGEYQKYINLLKTNHNLILTGAPGTGKTHLAKQIAKEMGAEVGFVQFHPSYDYTDFVEGLRPVQDRNGNLGFERRDGVFKLFCKNAFMPQDDALYQDAIDKFKKDIAKVGTMTILTSKTSTPFNISLNSRNTICGVLSSDDTWSATDKNLVDYLKTGLYDAQHDTYLHSIGDHIRKTYLPTVFAHQDHDDESKPFVFIIDEINRGEISKIFGELFFSIDPGYRGEKGKVDTQYQNMVEEDDVFKKGFYVPDNVYIIGTMNDIDRSMESMDFAIRRRFAWMEITAEESMQMLVGMPNEEELKNRMRNLNNAILKINGLGKAYQIGAAYFLKYEQYGDFELLWKYHLEGLLCEYLRGNPNTEQQLDELKKAYDTKSDSASNEPDDNHIGQ